MCNLNHNTGTGIKTIEGEVECVNRRIMVAVRAGLQGQRSNYCSGYARSDMVVMWHASLEAMQRLHCIAQLFCFCLSVRQPQTPQTPAPEASQQHLDNLSLGRLSSFS